MLGTTVKITRFNKLSVDLTAAFVRRKLMYDTAFLHTSYKRGYVVSCSNKYLKYFNNNNKKVLPQNTFLKYSTNVQTPTSSEQEISATEYDKISNETLESLTEFFDEIIEQAVHLEDSDVSYGDGVLTVKFGDPYGTYVVNRQTPNKQIWLSSPKSGPKRYDFVLNKWIYKHDGNSLHELLNSEIPEIVKRPVSFNKCSYSGKDIIMEIMEDGNLVDRVRILLQRDMKYYQEMQTVLREPVCVRVSGGKLDFPRHASFAAIKMVTWWEAEFTVAFKGPSGLSSSYQENDSTEDSEAVIKNIQPPELILLVIDTSEQLIEHLHTLIQESLDHADLTVLTATLGAAALVRNCLWCYNQRAKEKVPLDSSEKLYKCYKSFQEMSEAVAERLLDLHCRLISLYVLNEADSLSWESERSFFEKERSSYVIQMWWLYMQGTKADLWNTVSPKMAQRVFSGMLNESLTILTSRFVHGRPSLARSEQFWADAFNVLCCTAYLTLSTCLDGNEMIGSQKMKLPVLMRDIHSKCYELLVCLLLRGTPLKILYQVFRNGLEDLIISQPRSGPSPWLFMSAPDLMGSTHKCYQKIFPKKQAVILEINVLKSQPQPNWPQLVKVFLMNDYAVSNLLLRSLVRQCIGQKKNVHFSANVGKNAEDTCGGFLCAGNSCRLLLNITASSALYSVIYILVNTANDPLNVIVSALKLDPSWSNYLDRQQVWNQSRPPWLNALLSPLQPMMTPIVETLLDAVKTGASIYQAMSLALACLMELHICAPIGVLRTAFAMNEKIPAHCRPIGGSVLLQIMCAALYTALLKVSSPIKSQVEQIPMNLKKEPGSFDPNDKSASSLALAEALCSIDEDNKHTVQIEDFLRIVKNSVDSRKPAENNQIEDMPWYIEVLTDELLFRSEGRRSLKIAHEYLVRSSDLILEALKSQDIENSTEVIIPADLPVKIKTLTYIMFHIGDKPFDQLLIDYEDKNWERMFSIPLSIPPERIRGQLLIRPDLRNIDRLTSDEQEVANFLKQLCTTGRSARFR